MNTKAGVRIEADGSIQISGEMTFGTTPGLYGELENQMNGDGPEMNIDLRQVKRIDSSGLALLLEWQSMANRWQRALHINNAPPALLSLAKLCEADVLLDISERDLAIDAIS